jgi:hypothetical protein
MSKGRMRFVIAFTALSVAWIIYFQFRIDHTKLQIANIVEEMQRCGRIRLMATREDVIQAMGQPVKEVQVPSVTGGMATRLYWQYSAVKVKNMPHVDIDEHFNKVVEVDCAFTRSSARRLLKTGQAVLPQAEALPTDRKRY